MVKTQEWFEKQANWHERYISYAGTFLLVTVGLPFLGYQYFLPILGYGTTFLAQKQIFFAHFWKNQNATFLI